MISVPIVTNKCIDRHWKTDIGTFKYSIVTTFRSTSTGYRYNIVVKSTAPYRTVYLFVHFNQNILNDYGD